MAGAAFLYGLAEAVLAGPANTETGKTALQEITLLSGWAKGQLMDQPEYELTPIIVRLSYDPDVWLHSVGLDMPGQWRLNVEPFFSHTWSPVSGQEYGCGFFVRWQYPMGKRFSAYLEGGTGPIHMTLDSVEQSTGFNFIDQAGMGVTMQVCEKVRAELGYRIRHVSNAGFKERNGGIENDVLLLGLSYEL